LTQELKNQGVRWLVLEQQTGAVSTLKTLMKPDDHFLDIQLQDAVRLETRTSRAFLKSIGVSGEIIHTPGHSSDSMTLVLDEGLAFTGDLPGLGWTVEEQRAEVEQSWQKIREMNVKMVYPGHGPERSLDQFA
jgi:glyoxylase-like metal-dependent hydrolase (beta-lactamase superfamily II)